MKYQAILFDLDFTLYNECKYLKEVVVLSKIFDNLTNITSKITYQFRINSTNIIDDILMLGNKLTDRNRDLIFCLMKNIKIDLSCYNGIFKMLNEFKDNKTLKTGLVTNGITEIQKNKLQCLGISECFNHIVYTKEMGTEKPDHLPFHQALNQLEINPNTALYVGDHILNDIKAANDVGMDTLWVDHLNKNNIISTYRIKDGDNLSFTILNL